MPAYDRIDHLPEVLQAVMVRVTRSDGSGVDSQTRVLDLEHEGDREVVVVACPPDIAAGSYETAELSWTYPLGRLSCPVRTGAGQRPYGSVWLLTPDGPPLRVQDRRHFRSTMSVPLKLAWEESVDSEQEPVHRRADCITVDLSEGGVLALVRGEAPEVGRTVDATLLVGGEELRGEARVVRHVPYPGGVGVGVTFIEPNIHADALRRAAFDAERRRARAGR